MNALPSTVESDNVRQVLVDYRDGYITRHAAMNFLGISWYGELLDLMNRYDMKMKPVAKEQAEKMVAEAISVFEENNG